jgi:hypothetical protein
VESEGDESAVADPRRMIIRMFNKLKENMQKKKNKNSRQGLKKLKKTKKQLNELRISTNSKM